MQFRLFNLNWLIIWLLSLGKILVVAVYNIVYALYESQKSNYEDV